LTLRTVNSTDATCAAILAKQALARQNRRKSTAGPKSALLMGKAPKMDVLRQARGGHRSCRRGACPPAELSEDAIEHAHAIKVDAMTLLGQFLREAPKNNGAPQSVSSRPNRISPA
jgi:hypothetical protein